MPNKTLCIYVTGLPASGKTTTARYIAEQLKLKLLDKDDYLEQLFDQQSAVDMALRKQLSRMADQLFIADAKLLNSAVLVSHWRPEGATEGSGTPIDWLFKTFDEVIEVYCACTPLCARERFIHRKRHPGHNDGYRSTTEIDSWFEHYASLLPIKKSQSIPVNTESNNWQKPLIEKLITAF